MRSLDSTALGRASDAGPLLMRVGLGAVFAWHGWAKFDGGVSNFAGFLDSLNVPAPEVVAWLQVMAEGIGGLLLIAGVLTRFATLPLIAIMIGAITLVKAEGGFLVEGGPGASYETALMAGLLCLLFIGPGKFSVDALIGLEGRGMVAKAPGGRSALAT